ncbi:MAG TPA: uroporphyrinogen decarboxylase family protein [Sumerlaeia bacterium]|nr:uroporphyrinogen decarboxylase family protein [Sumerlaeia bacterium]
MDHRERFVRTLTGRKVDRVPFIKVFGGANAVIPRWERERPGISQCIDEILRFEGEYRGWQIAPVNMGLSRVGKTEILQENEARIVQRRGDGTVEILQKGSDFHHQTVEWPVKDRRDWDRVKSRHMQADDPGRFPDDWAACVERFRARDYPLQLTHGGVYGFARNLMGDEALAYAFYEAPDLVHDVMDSYTEMAISIWGKMVEDADFDLIECWEDMAFRSGSMVSPGIFREFMKPNYLKIAAFAKEHGVGIILVDSDGYIDDLTPLMLESGVTAMYPYEAQSGCDVGKMLDRHPRLGAIGGLDKQAMARGREAIDREMERARRLIRKGRFIPGPDHFVLSDVSWESYRYFMESLREVVMTTAPAP